MNGKLIKRLLACLLVCALTFALCCGCQMQRSDDTLTLRICNWEEYLDEGDWDEAIDLPNISIQGKNGMIDDFIDWYRKTYHKDIKIEYSCFGSNEELYNQLTLGDSFDLVCPSEYMIMKLMAEKKAEPYSAEFWDTDNPENYYARGVSSYMEDFVKNVTVNEEPIEEYAAGYMWGVTGIVYNPEMVTPKEADSWRLLFDEKFQHQVTMKDNVRDAYFAAVALVKADELMALHKDYAKKKSQDTDGSIYEAYHNALTRIMNDTSEETLAAAKALLSKGRTNFYSFESDSGKADMVTGKVAANYQWSGDAPYTLDQAEEDDFILNYSVPKEASNLWFDGWVMLKDGIGKNAEKKQACEAWVNFLSRPDNVVRNMSYIGYTSVIAGGDDSTIFDYANWCYSADDDAEETVDYDIRYFFDRDDAVLTTTPDQTYRQLFGQYPPEDVLERCAVMEYYGDRTTERLNQMWIDVRCFNPFE